MPDQRQTPSAPQPVGVRSPSTVCISLHPTLLLSWLAPSPVSSPRHTYTRSISTTLLHSSWAATHHLLPSGEGDWCTGRIKAMGMTHRLPATMLGAVRRCVYVSPSLSYLTSLILHLVRALKFSLSQVINQQSMLFWSVVQLVEWFGEVLHSQSWIDSDGFTAHSLNQLLHNEEVQENKMWTSTALI